MRKFAMKAIVLMTLIAATAAMLACMDCKCRPCWKGGPGVCCECND